MLGVGGNKMSDVLSTHLRVRTSNRGDFIDLTEPLRDAVLGAAVDNGTVFAFCAHTTCSLLINEWEEGAHDDLRNALDRLIPPASYYRHDDLRVRTQNLQVNEPVNGHAHVAQMLAGATSQMIPVIGGGIVLGKWQRLMLLELDGPRDRDIYFSVLGAVSPGTNGASRNRARAGAAR